MNLVERAVWVGRLAERVISGAVLSFEEAAALIRLSDDSTPVLLAWADAVRKHFRGRKVELCAILNARAGRCPEDCRFCAQAAPYRTNTPVYPLLPEADILNRARAAWSTGIGRFSLVTSGRGPGGDFDKILGIVRRLKKELPRLKLCASLGIISTTEGRALKAAGVDRYHHNLEAAASFFSEVCTTHRYTDRVAAILAAREAGLEVCAGGIIGLGENPDQRLELAFALRELGVNSVPVNVLHPIPGTPLAGRTQLPPLEILRTLAVFRLVLPQVTIRYAGGREHNLRDVQGLGLAGGVDGLITGDYLTTPGQGSTRDIQLIRDLALEV